MPEGLPQGLKCGAPDWPTVQADPFTAEAPRRLAESESESDPSGEFRVAPCGVGDSRLIQQGGSSFGQRSKTLQHGIHTYIYIYVIYVLFSLKDRKVGHELDSIQSTASLRLSHKPCLPRAGPRTTWKNYT